jgi:putative flippase GtrA
MLDMTAGPCQHHEPVSLAIVAVPPLISNLSAHDARAGRESLRPRLHCFARTMLVGFWANVLDFALLALCLRWLHIEALSSRVIALLVSGLITFIGSRSFAFRVTGGSVPKQAGRFIVAELAAVPLNLLSFQMCALCAPLTAPELVSFVANALVFVAFSYPVRRLLVFGAATAPQLQSQPLG